MTSVRQDAWKQDEDLLLAEVVLRYIREGGAQLAALRKQGCLSRTPASCGFRWNSYVRKQYKEAIELAKRQRKEKKKEVGMSKYQPLNDHLTELKGDFVSLSFSEIEVIISDQLPNSAFKYRAWWTNNKAHVQTKKKAACRSITIRILQPALAEVFGLGHSANDRKLQFAK